MRKACGAWKKWENGGGTMSLVKKFDNKSVGSNSDGSGVPSSLTFLTQIKLFHLKVLRKKKRPKYLGIFVSPF